MKSSLRESLKNFQGLNGTNTNSVTWNFMMRYVSNTKWMRHPDMTIAVDWDIKQYFYSLGQGKNCFDGITLKRPILQMLQKEDARLGSKLINRLNCPICNTTFDLDL